MTLMKCKRSQAAGDKLCDHRSSSRSANPEQFRTKIQSRPKPVESHGSEERSFSEPATFPQFGGRTRFKTRFSKIDSGTSEPVAGVFAYPVQPLRMAKHASEGITMEPDDVAPTKGWPFPAPPSVKQDAGAANPFRLWADHMRISRKTRLRGGLAVVDTWAKQPDRVFHLFLGSFRMVLPHMRIIAGTSLSSATILAEAGIPA
jgi:hypothetical protein